VSSEKDFFLSCFTLLTFYTTSSASHTPSLPVAGFVDQPSYLAYKLLYALAQKYCGCQQCYENNILFNASSVAMPDTTKAQKLNRYWRWIYKLQWYL